MQTVARPEDIQRSHSTRHWRTIRKACAVSCVHKHGSHPEAICHRINAAYLVSNKFNIFKYIHTYNTRHVCVNKEINCINKPDPLFSIQTALKIFYTYLLRTIKTLVSLKANRNQSEVLGMPDHAREKR